jgi:integrase
MGRLQMKNVATRDGRLYYRTKAGGKELFFRLPALDDPRFAAEYARHAKGDTTPAPPVRGSFKALCIEFRTRLPLMTRKNGKPLAKATVENYRRYVDMIERDIGSRPVKGLAPAHVFILRDRYAETPGTANNYLSVLRLMMGFAMQRDASLKHNPVAEVPALPLGEHEPWPDRLLIAALDAATPMTRLAVITGLCSGQRIGDVIRMQWGWCQGGVMQLVQEKTGKHVAVPMHPIWRAELAKHKRTAMTLLYDRSGRPFQTDATLRERIVDMMALPSVRAAHAECVAAEECAPDARFTFHGLRKNAACYLSETGLTDEEIGALTGMSPEMVRLYTRKVRVLRIANGLAERLAGGTPIPLKVERARSGEK